MYPFIRMTNQMFKARNVPMDGVFDTHISHHRCWPWDLDIFLELNNGRALTLYDLGRVPLGIRSRLFALLRKDRYGMTVAGSTVRYRRRLRNMQRFEMQSRFIGWDARFFYFEQSMWLPSGECAGQVVLRMAVTGPKGIVPPDEVMAELAPGVAQPALPAWVMTWIEAENTRQWPPDRAG